uniref:Uncharacterized protein n=1 Tax=Arundo donax TaxID=35708 RepID=A0A0A9BUV9_ARUDO
MLLPAAWTSCLLSRHKLEEICRILDHFVSSKYLHAILVG